MTEYLYDGKKLVEIDEVRLHELEEASKQLYPEIDPFFIHLVCAEQVMYEAGYEMNEEEVKELYNKAQEQMKIKEYHFKVE
jgi:hypothetical protein